MSQHDQSRMILSRLNSAIPGPLPWRGCGVPWSILVTPKAADANTDRAQPRDAGDDYQQSACFESSGVTGKRRSTTVIWV